MHSKAAQIGQGAKEEAKADAGGGAPGEGGAMKTDA